MHRFHPEPISLPALFVVLVAIAVLIFTAACAFVTARSEYMMEHPEKYRETTGDAANAKE